ncbi:MAG: complex I NDUFA9 subunit family protein [Legionellales bacterium]|jgi:NADH dehydrogenase
MKNIVILGGTGFVGRHLCAALVRQGYTVRVLSRNPEKNKDMTVLPTLTIRKVDVNQQNELNAVCKNADVVINLIGILNEHGSNNGSGFRKAHVVLAQKVIQACMHNEVPRLLHMSALNADSTKGSSHYLRTKGEAESYVHKHALSDIHVTSFRPSVIFGPGDSFLNRFSRLLNIAPGFLLLPVADSLYAPIYVNDVVTAMINSIKNTKTYGERYDLCGPKVYTLKQLVTYVAQLKHSNCKIIGLSLGLSKVMATMMEFLPGKPFSRDNYLSSRMPSVCSSSFPEVLNITPVTLESIAPTYIR